MRAFCAKQFNTKLIAQNKQENFRDAQIKCSLSRLHS